MKFCIKSKTKEKCFDITKTILSIVLAAAFGAAISHRYKVLEDESQIYTESRKAATSTYYEIIDLIGKRHYYALRAAIGFQFNCEQTDRWTDYDKALKNWNERRYSTLALINRYFGADTENKVYVLIRKFGHIHQKLLETKNLYFANKPIPDLNPLLDEIYKLDDDISDFSNDLQIQLRDGKVDVYSPKPPLKKP